MFTFATIVGGAGAVLILVGLVGGGITFSGTVIPPVGRIARVLCFAVGGVMLPLGVFLAVATPIGSDPPVPPSPTVLNDVEPHDNATTAPGTPVPCTETTLSERSAPDANCWSVSETNFLKAMDAEGIDYLAYGTDQDIVDLAWTICDSFSAGMTLEESADILIQSEIDLDTSATIVFHAVEHLCPGNSYILE